MKHIKLSILTVALISATSAQAAMQNFDNDMDLLGNAYTNQSHVSNGVILTKNQTNQNGNAFTKLSYANIERFSASFEMKLGGGSNRGSGLTFAWVNNPNVQTTGGYGLGFKGMTGYAVEFDTYDSSSSGADNGDKNHVAIIKDSTTNALLQSNININDFDLGQNSYSDVEIEFDSGFISVAIDGTNYINNFEIVGYAGFDGYFGFTAATGGSTNDWHKVRNFSLAVSPIPEPSTYALMLGGLGLVGFMAYRRRKTA